MGSTSEEKNTQRLDLQAKDTPQLELVVAEEIDEQLKLPQLIWADVNALALPYAVLNEREAKKSSGHELVKLENRNGKQIAIHWSVWPYPKLGMPTITTLRILFVLMQKAAEAKRILGHVPERLDIGSLTRLCALVGLKSDGYSRKLVKRHIEILLSTQCKSKGAFKNKHGEGLFIDCFNYLRKAGFVGEVDEQGSLIEHNFVVFDEHVRANLDMHYVKQIDLQLMSSIASPIGQLLYTKLSNLFHEANQKGWTYVEVEYQWLAERMGIIVYKELRKARWQLKQAIKELMDEHYIQEALWDEWKIRFTPGIRYTIGEGVPRIERKRRTSKKQSIQSISETPSPLPNTQNESIDSLLPLCSLYIAGGWKLAEIQAKRRYITEAQLKDECLKRGLISKTDAT
jgi:hypothetical protein